MKAPYFIAHKLLKKSSNGKPVSRPIVLIATSTIALALIVNLITISVVIGFQHEVRDKVIGFGAHATVTKLGENSITESVPLEKNKKYIELFQTSELKSINPVAYKAGILQAENENNGRNEIQSVVFKGIDGNYNLSFFQQFLVQGRLPNFKGDTISEDILISQKIADELGYKVGDIARVYFVKNRPLKRMFHISGIYNTGFEDLDKKIILTDIRNLQKLNDWGIKVALRVSDTLKNDNLILTADVQGQNELYQLNWQGHSGNYKGFYFFPEKDTTIHVKVGINSINEPFSPIRYMDSASLNIQVKRKTKGFFPLVKEANGNLKKEYLDNLGLKYAISDIAGNQFILTFHDGLGNADQFISGYEINFKKFEDIRPETEKIRQKILTSPEFSQEISVSSIMDSQSDIFDWLNFLDINVWIILVLMLFIGIINMSSALLVMILVRTHFIGLMKAIGSNNHFLRKIFLIQAGHLLIRALFWGNLIGIGFMYIQKEFHLIHLNPEVYYLDAVPIQMNFIHIILLNLATLLICIVALMLPARFVSKISPIKSIKFE